MDMSCAAEDAVALERPDAKAATDDLSRLYDEHAAAVYRLLIAMLGSPEDAQDALSEAFLKISRIGLRRIRNPRAYLLAAARHQAVSMLRRRRRETSVDASDVGFFDASGLDPQQIILASRIEAALRELPPEQREVIVLKVYEGLTLAEIAAITRTRANTVASRYRYAIEHLRRALEEADGSDHR
jgi:RNA polymerase sigma-70 factor (ECF subfamily)